MDPDTHSGLGAQPTVAIDPDVCAQGQVSIGVKAQGRGCTHTLPEPCRPGGERGRGRAALGGSAGTWRRTRGRSFEMRVMWLEGEVESEAESCRYNIQVIVLFAHVWTRYSDNLFAYQRPCPVLAMVHLRLNESPLRGPPKTNRKQIGGSSFCVSLHRRPLARDSFLQ